MQVALAVDWNESLSFLLHRIDAHNSLYLHQIHLEMYYVYSLTICFFSFQAILQHRKVYQCYVQNLYKIILKICINHIYLPMIDKCIRPGWGPTSIKWSCRSLKLYIYIVTQKQISLQRFGSKIVRNILLSPFSCDLPFFS